MGELARLGQSCKMQMEPLTGSLYIKYKSRAVVLSGSEIPPWVLGRIVGNSVGEAYKFGIIHDLAKRLSSDPFVLIKQTSVTRRLYRGSGSQEHE
jgi:hypothetical protein